MPVTDPADSKQYWLCRPGARGHKWDFDVEIPYEGQKDRTWSYHESKRCERCGTVCHTFYDVYFNFEYSTYIYPDGYKCSADDKPSTQQLREFKLKYKGG